MYSFNKNMYIKHRKLSIVTTQKDSMTTNVHKNNIYRKLNKDMYVWLC